MIPSSIYPAYSNRYPAAGIRIPGHSWRTMLPQESGSLSFPCVSVHGTIHHLPPAPAFKSSLYADPGYATVYKVTDHVLAELLGRTPSLYTPPRTQFITEKGDVVDAPLIKAPGKAGGPHRK